MTTLKYKSGYSMLFLLYLSMFFMTTFIFISGYLSINMVMVMLPVLVYTPVDLNNH